MRIVEAWGDLIRDGWRRFRRAWGWVLGEYVGLAVLIALGLAWTRVPEKYGWQVALTLVLPVVVLAAFLWLQAGLIRGFSAPGWSAEETAEKEVDEAHDKEDAENARPKWVPIAWGATTLLLWLAIGWLLWELLDTFDGHVFDWSAYLNSKFGPNARAHWASYANLSRDLSWAGWALRWVVVPGLLIPLGCGSAAWGIIRLPWRRAMRQWVSWKWWPLVILWAVIGEAWPQTWFESQPYGSVHAQVWRVMLKMAAAYLLAVTSWMELLGWGAMLLNPRPRTRMDEQVLTLGLGAPVRAIPFEELLSEEPDQEGGRAAASAKLGETNADAAASEPSGEASGSAAAPEPGTAAPQGSGAIGSEAAKPEDGAVGRPLPRGSSNGGGHA